MCCIEENKKRDFERLYEQEQWEKLKMLLTENAEEVSCLLTPGELRQMMETSGRPQNEDGANSCQEAVFPLIRTVTTESREQNGKRSQQCAWPTMICILSVLIIVKIR